MVSSHRGGQYAPVGPDHRFVLGCVAVYPRDKQEGETTAAERLLETLSQQYHHPIDVVVADALDASRVFIRAVLQHGWDTIIRLKDDQRLTILKDAQGLKKSPARS